MLWWTNKMTSLVLLLCVAIGSTVWAQSTPCSSKDPGPFLATPPTLTMDIYEASQQELTSAPEQYRAELRLHGEIGGQGSEGIVLEVMGDYNFLNPEDSFRFLSEGGVNYVQMYKPVDRDGPTTAIDDDINVFSFTLKCSLQSNSSDFVYYNTKIFVLDVNDNDPHFTSLPPTLTLNELTPSGLTVLTIQAEDVDISSNLTYFIVPRADLADDMSGQFSVDSVSGEVRVTGSLDFESMAEGTLVVTVQDSGSPMRTVTGTVLVTVKDGDDQGPAFIYPGCWTHRQRCAWPKYTTSTTITQGEPISVLPVPNKVKASVAIKAKDMDLASNPVLFTIASTIPPGQEDMFSVSTTQTGRGEYSATITPTTSASLHHGFEIFLQAEEQSSQKRFEVAMIFFEDPNHVCASGASSAQGQKQADSDSEEGDEEKYSEPIIALIIVVAILATFLLCLAIAFFCTLRRSSTSRSNDVTLNASDRNGHAAF